MSTFDCPIASSREDRLDRGPFAKLLSKTLLSPNAEGATVIGLTGAWGTGKSSVAAMVIEDIGERATVLQFEPWMVGSRDALVSEFFLALGKAIYPKAKSKKSISARSRFYRYGSSIAGVLATGAKTVGIVLPGAAAASIAAEATEKILRNASEGLEAQADEPSLRETRDYIRQDLSILTKPIIVVIDDIDRLDKDEVRATFQLIKACADFPNVQYLLLYDRDQVKHALEGTVNNPDAFLDKVINQSFDLPAATNRQRTIVLDEALSELGLHEGLPKSDMERLAMVFDEVLLPGLPTLRHVKRYVNTIRSLLPGVIKDGFRNIDPADFLALEYLRQYVPDLYQTIRDEDGPIPGGRITRMVHYKEWPKMVKDKRQLAVERLDGLQKELANQALNSIFKETGNDVASRRFITDYWKPVYLGFQEARAKVSEGKWATFVSSLANPEADLDWLREWDSRVTRDEWVAAITSRAKDIPWPESLNLLKILFDWGEKQRQETSAFFGEHNSWEFCVRFCVDAIMSVTPDELDPVAEMYKVIKSTDSIVATGYSIGTENERSKKDDYNRWARDYDIQKIIDPLKTRLLKMLKDDSIWDCSDVSTAITAAYYIVGNPEIDEWWNDIPKNEKRLIKYINRHLGEAETFNFGFEEGPLIEAIRAIDPTKLNDKGKAARESAMVSVHGSYRSRSFRRRPLS